MNNHNTDLFSYSPPTAPYETDDSNDITDAEDDDDSDGIIRMFCMSPKTRGELGRSDNFKTKYINNIVS